MGLYFVIIDACIICLQFCVLTWLIKKAVASLSQCKRNIHEDMQLEWSLWKKKSESKTKKKWKRKKWLDCFWQNQRFWLWFIRVIYLVVVVVFFCASLYYLYFHLHVDNDTNLCKFTYTRICPCTFFLT